MRRLGVVFLVVLMAGVFVCSAFSVGGSKQQGSTEAQNQKANQGPTIEEDGNQINDKMAAGLEDQRQMLLKMIPMMVTRQLAGFAEINNKFIDQLKRVRQIAETEGAAETMKAVDEAIAAREADYQKRWDEAEASYKKRYKGDPRYIEKAKRWHKRMMEDAEMEKLQKEKQAQPKSE